MDIIKLEEFINSLNTISDAYLAIKSIRKKFSMCGMEFSVGDIESIAKGMDIDITEDEAWNVYEEVFHKRAFDFAIAELNLQIEEELQILKNSKKR